MKTQLSILVKDSMTTFNPLLSIFSKTKVTMYLDGNKANPMVLEVNKTPYLIDITPGNHHVEIMYENFLAKMCYGIMDAISGLFLNGVFEGAPSAIVGMNKTYENVLDCTLNEGDILKLEAKPNMNGKVKIKIL